MNGGAGDGEWYDEIKAVPARVLQVVKAVYGVGDPTQHDRASEGDAIRSVRKAVPELRGADDDTVARQLRSLTRDRWLTFHTQDGDTRWGVGIAAVHRIGMPVLREARDQAQSGGNGANGANDQSKGMADGGAGGNGGTDPNGSTPPEPPPRPPRASSGSSGRRVGGKEKKRANKKKGAQMGTQRMSPDERVRYAFDRTPGKTVEEKLQYEFLRQATDSLQEIFGLGTPDSAQVYMDKFRARGLMTGADGSYRWNEKVLTIVSAGTEGGAPSPQGKPGPRPRGGRPPKAEPLSRKASPTASPSVGADTVVAQGTQDAAFKALAIAKPWLDAVALAAEDLLKAGITQEAYTAVRRRFEGLKNVEPGDQPRALKVLDALCGE